jgi:hypothetical protein
MHAATHLQRESILAFRARRHGLGERRPDTDLLDVVAMGGVQDTPPGNADVSLAARLDIDCPIAAEAVATKRLALTWSLRGAPHLVIPQDLAVFTLGAVPAPGTRASLWGQPEDALEVVERAMVKALRAPMTKAELSGKVTGSLAAELAPFCESCGVHHPKESVFRAAPLLGRIVLTSTAPVVLARAKTWLGSDATGDLESLRTELLLRYMRLYAPTTSGHFADWAGIAKADAKCRWEANGAAVVRTDYGYVLEEDIDEVQRGPSVEGVRLLPAKDGWLQARDRDLLFPDKAQRSVVNRTIGGPGVVLVDGAPAGVWRAAAKGRRLAVRWRPFEGRGAVDIESEAQRVAAARGLAEAVVAGWE